MDILHGRITSQDMQHTYTGQGDIYRDIEIYIMVGSQSPSVLHTHVGGGGYILRGKEVVPLVRLLSDTP